AYGALTYASFGVFWTPIGFLLAGEPYHFSDAQIGLFTLFGVAGALAARFAGRLADRGYGRVQTGPFVAATAVSFLLLWLGEQHLVALAAGVALLDLGIQGTHITNQSLFYPLRPDARSRLNTAYMTCYFAAGSLGSAAAAVVYTAYGWSGVCLLGAAFPAVGTVLWVTERARHRMRAATRTGRAATRTGPSSRAATRAGRPGQRGVPAPRTRPAPGPPFDACTLAGLP